MSSPVKVSHSQANAHEAALVNELPEHFQEDQVMSDDKPEEQTQIKARTKKKDKHRSSADKNEVKEKNVYK